jgi:serine/threonine-protein kinase PpkA
VADAPTDIQIPGHRILRQLGTGGMANVYLALQKSMEREVALKIMHPSLGATDPAFSERFVREAKIIAKLSHPHINAVHDVGVAGRYHYFTMEYLTGGDLKSRIRQGMPPRAALMIVRQIAAALAFAHSKGYVHRDVKPENVLFRDSGTAVLTDFGIAKTNDNSMTATGAVIGTPYYMSPEQAMGRPTDKRSDLYSLGAMMFEMLTGAVPYDGDSAVSIGIKHVKDPLPQLPPRLYMYQSLLEKFLAKNPAHRFQSGEEAITAIDAVLSGASTTSAMTSPAGLERTVVMAPGATAARTQVTSSESPKRRSSIIVATALVLALIAVAAYVVLHEPTEPPVATVSAPVEPSAPAPTTVEPKLSAQQAEETARAEQIEQLLTAAEGAVRAGRYFGPSEDAAVPEFQHVLELEPGNARATRALNEIAGQFIAQAEHAIEKKNFDEAETLLNRAEQADASHPMLFSRRLALNELRQQQAAARTETRPVRKSERPVRTPPAEPARSPRATPVAPVQTVAVVEDPRARERREREQKLQNLLTRFRDLTAPASLSAARVGMAQDLMREATRLAADDGRVRGLPASLAEAYLKLAAVKVEEKEYQEAGALVQRGLELRPNHPQLQALQKDIAERTTKKRQTFGSF